ncbi:MAG: hypothetical protein HY062_01980 [Bacteroidetes bacterium]|nr:hypothetical protein [Bacteroidota bacterium]
MKKQILLIIFVTLTFFINAQILITAGKHQYDFFKSYEDYKADKAVDGIQVTICKGSNIEYTENGAKKKSKASKLPYSWFCNSEGMLMRVFDGDLYYVVVDGAVSFYIKVSEGTISKPDNADYIISGDVSNTWPNEYYSLTPNGTIEKLKDKILEEYLEKYNLTSQYENDPNYKRQAKDCVMCWANKKTNKKIKYTKLINEKIK